MHTNDSEWNSSDKLVRTWWRPKYFLGHLILEILSLYPLHLLQTSGTGHKTERMHRTIREREYFHQYISHLAAPNVWLCMYTLDIGTVRLIMYVYVGHRLLQRFWSLRRILQHCYTHTHTSGTFYGYTAKLIQGVSRFVWCKRMFELGWCLRHEEKTCVRCRCCFFLQKRRRLLAKCIPRQSGLFILLHNIPISILAALSGRAPSLLADAGKLVKSFASRKGSLCLLSRGNYCHSFQSLLRWAGLT